MLVALLFSARSALVSLLSFVILSLMLVALLSMMCVVLLLLRFAYTLKIIAGGVSKCRMPLTLCQDPVLHPTDRLAFTQILPAKFSQRVLSKHHVVFSLRNLSDVEVPPICLSAVS